MRGKGDVHKSRDRTIIGFEILSVLRQFTISKDQEKDKLIRIPFLAVALFIILKEQKKKTLKEYFQLKIRKEIIRKILLCNIKEHKITQCCHRRKNKSSVFQLRGTANSSCSLVEDFKFSKVYLAVFIFAHLHSIFPSAQGDRLQMQIKLRQRLAEDSPVAPYCFQDEMQTSQTYQAVLICLLSPK